MVTQGIELNKDLVAASATPLVPAVLAERDSYGYAILKRVSELSGGRLEWSDGMLYPVLHRLERLGHIAGKRQKSESGRRRKYYRITARGLPPATIPGRRFRVLRGDVPGQQAAARPRQARRAPPRSPDGRGAREALRLELLPARCQG